MSNKRTTMRKLREILRLRLQAGLSIRAISRSTKLSVGGVQKLLSRAEALSLTWPLPAELDDARLAALFYPGADADAGARREVPDWAAVHEELKRPHVTKRLVWEEYTQQYPNRCYGYSQFCDRYRHWLGQQQRTMRQVHQAGEKCFVDYGGDTAPVIDAATGEVRPAQLFVAVLGASDYTFAEATWTQTLPDWLGSHTRAMSFFGGVPAAIVPDNLRSGVNKACRYDPDINPSYQQWAEHYQVAILPARLVEQECLQREQRKQARFKLRATLQDIDYEHPRNLQQAQVATLAQGEWLTQRTHNLLITGPCGAGKTFIACALGHQACLQGHTTRYVRLARLFLTLTQVKADGSYHLTWCTCPW